MMNFFKNYSLLRKITLSFTLVIFLSLSALGIFSFLNTQTLIEEAILESHHSLIKNKTHETTNKVDQFKADLRFISKLPSIAGIIRAIENDGVDNITNSTYKQWISRFEQTTKSVMQERHYLNFISFYNADGDEQTRLFKNAGEIEILDIDELLEETEAMHFKSLLNMKKNELRFSKLLFDTDENDNIINPKTGFYYLSTPIIIDEKFKGSILFKMQVQTVFGHIYKGIEEGGEYYVVNSKDELLIYKDQTKLFVSGEDGAGKLVIKNNEDIEDKKGYSNSSKSSDYYIERLFKFSEKGKEFIIGVKIPNEYFSSKLNRFLTVFGIIVFFSISLVIVISLIISKALVRSFSVVLENLTNESVEISDVSKTMDSNSKKLLENAVSQAEAFEETSASLTEISSMNKSNMNNVEISTKSATDSKNEATEGQKVINQMQSKIDDLNNSFADLKGQINDSNNQMLEMVGIIKDISSKTKIIDDIVFQTKLLSFNASVEAARAGELGKGFSVVADEIGNLANSSGDASKDINKLLNDSQHKVEQLVSQSKDKLSRSFDQGEKMVVQCVDISKECGEILSRIVDHSKKMNDVVNQIAGHIKEESVGIDNIAEAVISLESSTIENTKVSKFGEQTAKNLLEQSSRFSDIVVCLEEEIYGAKKELKQKKNNILKLFKYLKSKHEKKNSKDQFDKVA